MGNSPDSFLQPATSISKERAVDPLRYKGPAVALTIIVAILSIVDLLARTILYPDPSWVVSREDDTQAAVLQTIGERLATIGVEQADAGDRIAFGAVLGFSTVREGIDPVLMEEIDPSPRRWLNLGTSGGSMLQIHEQASLLLRSGVLPEVAVFGIHAQFLVRQYFLKHAPTGVAGALASLRRLDATGVHQAMSIAWMMRMRAPMNHIFWRTLLDARLRYLAGHRFDVLFSPSPRPWQVELLNYPLHRRPEALDRQMKGWASRGWFDPVRYAGAAREMDLLKDVLRRCQEHGIRPLVLLMPETTALRSKIPGRAAETILAQLGDEGEGGTPFLDARAMIPDDQFTDHGHLNVYGRGTFSRSVANWVDKELGSQ